MCGYYELENTGNLSAEDVHNAIKKISTIDGIIIDIWNDINAGVLNSSHEDIVDTIKYHIDKNRYNVFRAHLKNTYMAKQLIAKALEDLDNFNNLRIHLNLQHNNKRRGVIKWLKEKVKKITTW